MCIRDRRKGHCIGTVNTKETTARELTERMVGAAVDLSIHRPEPLRDVYKRQGRR